MPQFFFYFLLLTSISAFSQSNKLGKEDQKALNSLRLKLKNHNLTICAFLKDMGDIEARNRRKSQQIFPNSIEKSIENADFLNKKHKSLYFKKTGMNQDDATLSAVFVYFKNVEYCN